MATMLADPSSTDDLYLPVSDVPAARPLLFGDVLRDVTCSRGGEPMPLAMIVTHPCSMRRGLELKPEFVVAEVTPAPPGVARHKWVNQFFDLFPLLDSNLLENETPAVNLLHLHSVRSDSINVVQRVVSLSDSGISVFLQRWIHQLCRDEVDLPTLAELVAPVLAEVELQEEWCAAAVRAAQDQTQDAVIDAAAKEFQEMLGRPGAGGWRDRLSEAGARPGVRREISSLRRAKYGS